MVACFLTFVLLFGTTGCNGLAWFDSDKPVDQPSLAHEPAETEATDAGESPTFERPLQHLVIDFEVHRVSATRGTFGDGSRIWGIATGPLAGGAAIPRLTANGFRAGVGRRSDRPALMDYLESLEGLQVSTDRVTPDTSRMIEVELGPCPAWQNIFYYDRQGSLRGMDFVDAEARLNLDFEMHSSNLREVRLRVVPELEEPPGPPKWQKDAEGAYRQVPQEHRHLFKDLAFEAKIPEGGFLVVGPTPAVYDRPLLARPFFLRSGSEGAGKVEAARESIYIISPIVRSYSQGRTPKGAGSF